MWPLKQYAKNWYELCSYHAVYFSYSVSHYYCASASCSIIYQCQSLLLSNKSLKPHHQMLRLKVVQHMLGYFWPTLRRMTERRERMINTRLWCWWWWYGDTVAKGKEKMVERKRKFGAQPLEKRQINPGSLWGRRFYDGKVRRMERMETVWARTESGWRRER